MADYTEDDVARLAHLLDVTGEKLDVRMMMARQLLYTGQVHLSPPPPDPADVVAEALSLALWPYFTWDPAALHPEQERLIAAMRDLFSTDALEAAAAKVQEAGS